MKKFNLSIFLILLFLVCASKRNVFNSVPALIEYKLFYPDEALERKLEGKVVVSVLVLPDGGVEDVKVHKSSGNNLLDSAAVKTAETFIFSPATSNNEPVKSLVLIPVEFRLKIMDFETWITQVKVLQQKIKRQYSKVSIQELYDLYKKFIYSTRAEESLDINYYIKETILDRTAKLWEGYWTAYPASSLLFIDIINRYPDSFISFKAKVDFNKYFQKEKITIKQILLPPKADSLINRLLKSVED